MVEYREKPEEFVAPSDQEVAARKKRNLWIALALAAFMLFVFFTLLTKARMLAA